MNQLNNDNLKDYQNKYTREAAMSQELNERLNQVNQNLEEKTKEYKKKVEDIVDEKNQLISEGRDLKK